MTLDRMLKTFFWARQNKKVINPDGLLKSSKGYSKWHQVSLLILNGFLNRITTLTTLPKKQMCHSKLCGNRASRFKNGLDVTQKSVDNYLRRCQWIHRYWSGELQELGGPDPRDCPGYKAPSGSGQDLKEYGGKVRLVPS